MAYLSESDHDRVTAAVTAAEAHTSGEIVTVVTRRSDDYHDVMLHWAILKMLGWLAILAAFPGIAEHIHRVVAGEWAGPASPSALLTIAMVLAVLAFAGVRIAFAWRPLRLAFTPAATKARRVRRRALTLFRSAAEARTTGATGVLLYLSVEERRAEIIADAAIHSKVDADVWGDAMAALLAAVRDSRPGDGMADAVERIGAILAPHFPRDAADTNELPDRLIEL